MSVHLVRGTDPVLRDDAVRELVVELLAGEERTLALEDFVVPGRAAEGELSGGAARAAVVDAAVAAASTPPFMTAKRIVVLRDVGNLTKDDAAALLTYLDDPAPTSELVLVAGGGTTPKALEDRLKQVATVTAPGSERPVDVLARLLAPTGLTLRPDAASAVVAHVGGDPGLLPGLVATLAAAYGDRDAALGVDDVAPYLGDEGSIPVWDLTNAIERGDTAEALRVLQRLLSVTSPSQPRPLHPLQVLATLHGHYRRLLRLDDPAIRTSEEAAAALGGRMNPKAASFRLRQARALGTEGLRAAFDHLVRADLDLKGERAVPSDVVLEILVARLTALSGRSGARPASRRA